MLFSERVVWPSLLIFFSFFSALLTSVFASYFNYFFGITCLLLSLCLKLPEKFTHSYLSMAVIGFIIVNIANLIFIDNAYTSKEFYYIAFFAIGFIVFSQLNMSQITHIYKLLVYLFLLLTVWAFIQYYTGHYYLFHSGLRSNTIFTTPNTYAAAINLILFPLIAINIYKNNIATLVAMLVIFYSLLLTQSRGGLISFFIGFLLMLTYSFLRKQNKKLYWKKVFISLAAVVFVFYISHTLNWTHNNQQDFDILEVSRLGELSKRQKDRLVLYDVTWQLIKKRPIVGYGYHNFQYYWLKDQKPPFQNSITKFVHNDYLQIWMETGIAGLFFMLSIIIIFYFKTSREYKHYYENGVLLLAIVGSLTAFFTHAMVDFVIYPCFLAMLFSAYLATTVRVCGADLPFSSFMISLKKRVDNINFNKNFWKAFVSILLILLFTQPYIAELAFKQAEKYRVRNDIKQAIPYYELARRFEPYNPNYYLVEGSYWRWLLMQNNNLKQVAQRADYLFNEGSKSNPFNISNLFSRAILHRDYPELLIDSENDAQILVWFEKVLYWRPWFEAGQVEYVKTLYHMGHMQKAKEMYEKYIIMNPGSDALVKLEKLFT